MNELVSNALKGALKLSLLRFAMLATLVGLLLAALGPFGSYLNDGYLALAAYWITVVWIGFAVYVAAIAVARRAAPAGTIWAWPFLILSILAASVPQTSLTRLISFRLWPHLADLGLTWTTWYLQVALLGMILGVGLTAVFERGAQFGEVARPGSQDRGAEPGPQQLLELAAHEVLALQMEDHYVRVHTAAGSRLVHTPLAQAIESLGAKDGLRTHRSWWVARNAVQQVHGTPRSMTLVLSNGIVAPVARSSVATLRAAGWLDNQF